MNKFNGTKKILDEERYELKDLDSEIQRRNRYTNI
jgi:hypothetical protein